MAMAPCANPKHLRRRTNPLDIGMAFLQPHTARQPIFRAPGVVLFLIAALVAAHVARMLIPPEESLAWINQFAFIPARYSPAFLSQHGIDAGNLFARALPFLSYMALHGSYTHLAVNCLFLLAFGPIVARRFGAVLFLLFFIICGVASAAAYLAFNWGSMEPVIGASGAISGLMAPAIRLLPTERPAWAGQPANDAAMLPVWSRQILWFSLIWAILNVVTGITGLGTGGDVGLIAWQAHLGGFVCGLLLSGPFDRLRPRTAGEPL
jgi:membrane associated rhomboid family serine protease